MGTKGLGQKISWVRFSGNMFQDDHTCSYSFPNPIIGNITVLILEGDIDHGETVHHTLIITHNLSWSTNRNSGNYDLVAYFHGQFRDDYRGHQL